ncbi:DHH family phosphoesterase, partial [Rivihabitans pingtungensis]|uniref:DHH family phosphoesterase n=1 Tax=Rivihabitans pingtungensis TaxID=1054498 RepID=UPI0023F36013
MTAIAVRAAPEDARLALQAQGLPPLFSRLFAARGVARAEQLDYSLKRLLPYHTLKDIGPAAVRLADAIARQERMLVVADYDADGATACALAVRGLRRLGGVVEFIVPNRFEYGYGLTPEIVELAAQRRPDLLITVDNGVASVAGVQAARRHGMDVLITDHHLAGDELPDALIVNPNQPGCQFPSKHLAGVGVMFYVLMALRAELRQRGAFAHGDEPNLADWLDLVALGTVADVVKLDDNNRILVEQGLRRMRAGRACAGVNALFAAGGPSEAGSMRRIQLKRGNKVVSELDLYDLLLKGDKSTDLLLASGDVIYIPSAGPQAAIHGSVRAPAIYELKGKETLKDLIELAGGVRQLAQDGAVSIERVVEQKGRVVESMPLKQAANFAMRGGDIAQLY